jgi:hypothetical protein
MDTPTYNAEGMQIYKPQPGEYWKSGLRFRESYGGIIAEIQDAIEKSGNVSKTYPQNFAGIIAAINDLADLITEGQLPSVGVYPPGWDIITDGGGNIIGGDWQENPKDGELWFDQRQGRLFIAIDGQYWQTNGGDGIASVGPNPPVNPPVIGSTWFDNVNEVLYVAVLVDDPDNPGTDILVWNVVKGAGEVTLTTATLPLAISRSTFDVYEPTIIPDVPIDQMGVQKDYNEYIFAALTALDKAATESTVSISDTPPTDNVVNGTLWYDSSSLEMSIWYEDDDAGQWVPTAVSYPYDDDLAIIRSSVVAETAAREYAVAELLTQIQALQQGGIPDIDTLEQKVALLEDHVENHPVEVDLTGYTTNTVLASTISTVTDEINAVRALLPDVTPYATKAEVNNVAYALTELPTTADVDTAIAAASPDLSSFVTQADINTSIDYITTEYLPRTGGTLSGSFVVQKVDSAYPAFDFSTEKWYGNKTHKYRTNSITENYATFGTNENPWEYAWDFSSDEDFCWVFNDNNKVFSITKDGPACSQLYIGDFDVNTEQGREVKNKIDVRDRLTKYQLAFTEMRQGVASATDFDELKANILTALANV